MTEDEFDQIASAYADGEATPEEVSIVEGDPELMATVEQIRTLSQQLSAPTSVPEPASKQQHLAVALEEFVALNAGLASTPSTDRVEDNTFVGRQDSGAESASVEHGNVVEFPGPSRRSNVGQADTPKGFPRWLAVAAAFVVFGGGAALLVSQGGGDNDTEEMATEDLSTKAETETSEKEPADQGEIRAEMDLDTVNDASSAEADATDTMDDEAMDDEALAADAMEDSEAESTSANRTDNGDAEDGSNSGGFFPNEPMMSFDELPEAEQLLVEMPERRSDLFGSVCSDLVDIPAGFEIVAFLPIEVAGAPAEVLVLSDADGAETGLILDATCSQL